SLQKTLCSGDQVVPALREWLGIDEGSGAGEGGGRGGLSAATRLIRLVQESGAELFHDDTPVPFITFEAGEGEDAHRETWPLRNLGFRRWLACLFYGTQGKSAGAQAIADAVAALEGIALFEGPERPAHDRTAEHKGRLSLDLATPRWQAVEVDAAGWRVIDCPPVRFRRSKGMQSLPVPQTGGSLTLLRPFVNVRGQQAWVLL